MTLTPRHLLSAFALLLLLSLGLASSSGGADAAAQLYQVKFTSGSQYLVIEFLDNNLVHFELSAVGTGPAAGHKIFTSPMVAKTDYTGPTSLLNDGHGNLETPDIRLQVDTVSLCITAWDKTHDPDLLLSNICPRNLDQPWKGINIAPSGFTNVYGLGEQFLDVGSSEGDWVGRTRTSGNEMGNALVNWNGGMVDNTQFPILYVAGAGMDNYALFMDNPYRQTWNFTGSPWTGEMWGDWLRFYLMTGPDLPDLRQDYMELTGRPPVPPKKMFGLWLSEFGYNNWPEMDEKLTTLRANHFPIDGFVLDLYWFGGISAGSGDSSMGKLTWDLTNFSDPVTKIQTLRDTQGIGIMTIEESYISQNLPEHADLQAHGFLVRDCAGCAPTYLTSNPWWGVGGMIDWTNDAAGAYWHNLKREPLIKAGVIGHWTDLGEPEAYNSPSWYFGALSDYRPPTTRATTTTSTTSSGARASTMATPATAAASARLSLSRSGTSGIQRFGDALWAGDISSRLSSLATFMNVQMHMSMSGIDYFGADIGGLYRSALDGDLNDLYTQWFANGMAFDVPGRPHTENLCNCRETAPDRVGDMLSNLDNVRQRYELSPYTYSLAYRAYLYGEPLVPPLFYYYQSDPAVREMGHEKLIGRDLLAAIVAAYGETQRNVYLPAGDWIDYHTNQRIHSSGAWFGPFPEYIAGRFKLPLFARSGAILPQMFVDDKTMNIFGKRTDGSVRDELIARVYADPAFTSFTLYEDDGQTIAYQSGAVRTTLLSQKRVPEAEIVTVAAALGSYTGAPDKRDNVIRLVIDSPERVTNVTLNGAALTQYPSLAALYAAPSGWFNAWNNMIIARSGYLPVISAKTFRVNTLIPVYLPDVRR